MRLDNSLVMQRERLLRQARAHLEERLRAGEAIRAEVLLAEHPRLAAEEETALELISDEFFLRRELGQQPDPEEWFARFPQYANRLRKTFEVLLALDAAPPRVDDVTPPVGSSATTPTLTRAQADRYELREELGRGGMGVVYRAWQTDLRRFVALKLVLAGQYADAAELRRFHLEARSAASLQHPNIVQVHEVGERDGCPFLAMELVAGGTLTQRLAGKPLPAAEAAPLVQTLAEAMQFAHQQGIVHRDLKPANILLHKSEIRSPKPETNPKDRNPKPETTDHAVSELGFSDSRFVSDFELRISSFTPKVSDFGLAKWFGDAAASESYRTESGGIVGTASYMAPEQAEGRSREVGPVADVYALGAILYECLTGRPPFLGASPLETLWQVKQQEPVPPRQLNARVPRDLETICLKCLAKEPGRRYGSAAALAEDLRRFQEGRPILARPAGWVEQTWLWGKRNPREATITALVLLLLILGGGAAWWTERQRHHAETERGHRLDQAHQRLESTLTRLPALRQQFLWEEATALLRNAEQEAADFDLATWRQQIQTAQRDLQLAERLDEIRLNRTLRVDGQPNPPPVSPKYAAAFAEYGLDLRIGDVPDLAQRVTASTIPRELIAALDDWAVAEREEALQARLLALAQRADPGPWQDAVRDRAVWTDREKLQQLARAAEAEARTPALLILLARKLGAQNADGMRMLQRAQQRHPRDFWLSFELARWFQQQGETAREEALGYYRAALAVRPHKSAYNNLGIALRAKGDYEGAFDAYHRALLLDPKFFPAHFNRGFALQTQGDQEAAIASYRRGLELDPTNAPAHHNLGGLLRDRGEMEAALACCVRAVELDPGYALAHYGHGQLHYRMENMSGAMAAYEEALRLRPDYAEAHCNLGRALRNAGRFAPALTALRRGHELGSKDPRWSSPSALWVSECERLVKLDSRWPAVLEEASDLNANDLLTLAEVCRLARQHYATSARHYAAAFQASPKLHATHRYEAARAALLAAAGQGADASALDEMERARLRRQALTWLRSQLWSHRKALESSAKYRVIVLNYLAAWRYSPDLASVREEAGLAQLPTEEQPEWRKFWEEVERLRQAARTQEPKKADKTDPKS